MTFPNLKRIHYTEIPEEPGQFCIELFFKRDAKKTGPFWCRQALGNAYGQDFFPGYVDYIDEHHAEGAYQFFVLEDLNCLTAIKKQKELKTDEDGFTLDEDLYLVRNKSKQFKITKALGVPYGPASMAMLLTQLVTTDEIDEAFALKTLRKECKLGHHAATELLQRSAKQLEQNKGIGF